MTLPAPIPRSRFTPHFAWRVLILIGILAGAGAGWANGEWRVRQLEVQHQAELKASRQAVFDDGFYRGSYAFCRIFGEGIFQVSPEGAMTDCNEFLVTAREKNFSTFLYWQMGYQP